MNKNNTDLKNILTVLVCIVFVVLVFLAGASYGVSRMEKTADGTARPAPVNGTEVANNNGAAPAPTAPTADELPSLFTLRASDVEQGSGPFLLIEYSDFECPFCKRFHPVVKELVASGEVSWVYRHLPLAFHETADEGAAISECVRIHKGGDAFWAFVDAVFEAETPSLELYRSLAQQAGLTSAQVDSCLASGSEAQAVLAAHLKDTQLFGINGTPGSFVLNRRNNKFVRVPGALPLEGEDGNSMRALIDSLR